MKYYKENLSKTERVAQNLFLLHRDERVQINPEEIIYIEADVNYSTICTTSYKLKTAFHIGFFDQSLKDCGQFFRTHKSFLINLNYVKDYNSPYSFVEMQNGLRVEVSRRRKVAFKNKIANVTH